MYHDTPTTYMSGMHHALPSPDYTGDSDSDSDIIYELEQKRRQLDEDIARFTAQKDTEFRNFEKELKAKRKRKHVEQHQWDNANNFYQFTKNSPSATPPSQSVLSGCEKKVRSPQIKSGFRQTEPRRLMKPHAGPKVTPATICLDKTNIASENLQKSYATEFGTPPTPTVTPAVPSTDKAHVLPITSANHASSESGSIQSEPPREKPSISPDEKKHEEVLTGLFVPSYLSSLNALDGQNEIKRPLEGTQTEPTSPTQPNISIDAMLQASSLPTESSLAESFQVPTAKRAYTSPTVTRATLAPIIRSANGRKRSGSKRKHVTFQLADRAIVEPSSSYEEGPSPDIEEDLTSDRRTSNDSVASASSLDKVDQVQQPPMQKRAPPDAFGRRKHVATPEETPSSQVGMSMGDLLFGNDEDSSKLPQPSPKQQSSTEEDGYFSPQNSTRSPTSSSPEKDATFVSVDENAYINRRKNILKIQKLERRNSKSPNTSPSVSRQASFEESSNTDTKMPNTPRFSPGHSPAPKPMQRSFPGFLEDDLLSTNNNVGFFELDEELSSPSAGVPRPDQPEDKEEELEMSKRKQQRRRGHGKSNEIQTGSSVPIDIVKPGSFNVSNSWIGTFGH